MAHEVPALPYDYDALEPTIDEQTMRIHHDKHHQAYVDNLNAAIAGTEWADTPIEELLQSLDSLPEDKRAPVRNNGGGHYNHTFFWPLMSADGGSDPPDGTLKDAIEQAFGDVASLKAQVNDAGVKRFGSGWTWLVRGADGSLSVESTPNQDSPLMEGRMPILGIDVWEHSYYLKYQNRRPEYLGAWWDVVSWETVQQRFES
jgi:superoxide dismutase, Fe-Mn family